MGKRDTVCKVVILNSIWNFQIFKKNNIYVCIKKHAHPKAVEHKNSRNLIKYCFAKKQWKESQDV